MMNQFLPTNVCRAPKKKFRGHSRYFKKLLKKAAEMTIGVGNSDWYDQWHTHIDWNGYGNLQWKFRFQHLEALAITFRSCAEQLDRFKKDYQLFLYLSSANSQDDGVYIHTENPNGSDFPCIFQDTAWGVNVVSSFFQQFLPEYQLRAGVQHWLGQQVYLIYAQGIGLPIEAPNNGVQSK